MIIIIKYIVLTILTIQPIQKTNPHSSIWKVTFLHRTICFRMISSTCLAEAGWAGEGEEEVEGEGEGA